MYYVMESQFSRLIEILINVWYANQNYLSKASFTSKNTQDNDAGTRPEMGDGKRMGENLPNPQ
jgi:hypothetical protein